MPIRPDADPGLLLSMSADFLAHILSNPTTDPTNPDLPGIAFGYAATLLNFAVTTATLAQADPASATAPH